MRANNTVFDVIVVGGGPIGSVVAEKMAQASLRVALLEKRPQVGLPSRYVGLISPRALELVGVTEEAVDGIPFDSAQVWGPGG